MKWRTYNDTDLWDQLSRKIPDLWPETIYDFNMVWDRKFQCKIKQSI